MRILLETTYTWNVFAMKGYYPEHKEAEPIVKEKEAMPVEMIIKFHEAYLQWIKDGYDPESLLFDQ